MNNLRSRQAFRCLSRWAEVAPAAAEPLHWRGGGLDRLSDHKFAKGGGNCASSGGERLMKKLRYTLWGLAALVLVAALVFLTPGSPFYLPKPRRASSRYDGRFTREWVEDLKSSDAETRYRAIKAIGAMGDEADEAVPALAAILVDDPDREARHQASLSLAKMVPASRTAVPELARALQDKEPFVRVNAARALARLGAEARAAVPALIEALSDDSNKTDLGNFYHSIQDVAALALGRASAGTDAGVPALIAFLKSAKTDSRRQTAVRALGEVGAEARPAAPLLRALLKDKSRDVRRTAEEALKKIGLGGHG